ncbi:MAG: STAS domain-containing protein [Actinomycetes bacterium]
MAPAITALAGAYIAEEYFVVHLRGDLDINTVTPLRDHLLALASSATRMIVLDLAGVTFVESSALGMFVGVSRLLRDRALSFVLANVTGRVARTVEYAALHRAMRVAFVDEPVRPWECATSAEDLLRRLGVPDRGTSG